MADHVFICYAREDKEFVLPLAENLKRRGVPVWLDQWDIPPGSDWDRSIDNAIYECAKFIIVLSDKAVNSSEVRGELRTAIDEKKPIIPVIRAPCRVPRQLRTIQHADFSSKGPDDETTLSELVRTLESSTARATDEAAESGSNRAAPATEPTTTEKTRVRPRVETVRSDYRHATFALNNRYAVAAVVGIIIGLVAWWQWPPGQEPEVVPPPPPAAVAPAPVPRVPEPSVVAEKPAAVDRPKGEKKSSAAGAVFRDRLKSGGDGPAMVVIPSGDFRIGSPQGEIGRVADEGPQRQIVFSKDFAIGQFEVTVGEFRKFVDTTGYKTEAEQGDGCRTWNGKSWEYDKTKNWQLPGFTQNDRHPVVCVSWNDVQRFLSWIKTETGKSYRLPSEAEWEYATRAKSPTSRYWGDDPNQACRNANVADRSANKAFSNWKIHDCDDGYVYTAPVGNFAANNFRLHDTLGNAWEWVEDCWHKNYEGMPANGRAWKEENGGQCGRRVFRGGSWSSGPGHLRSSFRYGDNAGTGRGSIGFRLAQDIN